jgi:hypothetical protein
MKRIIAVLVAVAMTCGISLGQDKTGPNSEHLKGFDPMIGTWRYEGPLLEDVQDIAKKGTNFVFQFSWKRILDKSAVEENWGVEYEGGKKISGKAITGWNAAKKQLVYGGMDSLGGMTWGTITPDTATKTMPLTAKGIDGDGKETSFIGIVKKTDEDTLTWQGLGRVGGGETGDSPVYTLKRVEKVEGSKRAK